MVAEVGAKPDGDQIYRISWDGSVSDEPGFVAFGGQADQVAAALKEGFSDGMSLTEALGAALAALAAPAAAAGTAAAGERRAAGADGRQPRGRHPRPGPRAPHLPPPARPAPRGAHRRVPRTPPRPPRRKTSRGRRRRRSRRDGARAAEPARTAGQATQARRPTSRPPARPPARRRQPDVTVDDRASSARHVRHAGRCSLVLPGLRLRPAGQVLGERERHVVPAEAERVVEHRHRRARHPRGRAAAA